MEVHCYGCDAWTHYDPSHYATPVTRCYCSACYDRLDRIKRDAEKMLRACREELAQMKAAARPKYARRDGFPPQNRTVLWQALSLGSQYGFGGYDHEEECWFGDDGDYGEIDPLEVMWQYLPNLEVE